MKDKKFIPFWMEKEKIEIIEAYAECIHNGEVLLERIEKAIEYIEKHETFSYDENCNIIGGYEIDDLLNILRGDNNV